MKLQRVRQKYSWRGKLHEAAAVGEHANEAAEEAEVAEGVDLPLHASCSNVNVTHSAVRRRSHKYEKALISHDYAREIDCIEPVDGCARRRSNAQRWSRSLNAADCWACSSRSWWG